MARLPIGEMLRQEGVVTASMIEYALTISAVSHERVGKVLLRLRFVTDSELARCLANQANVDYVNLENYFPSAEVLEQIPFAVAKKQNILPLAIENGRLLVATDDPFQRDVVSRVGRFSNYAVTVAVASISRLHRKIRHCYYAAEHSFDEAIARIAEGVYAGQEFSAEQLFDLLVSSAIDLRASDLHISPTPIATLVSYRIDGVLQLRYALPASAHDRVVSACKVRTGMDIADTHRPQDGGVTFSFLGDEYDLRVSTMPATMGENLVIRVLSGGGDLISMEEIGFDPEQLEIVQKMTQNSHGTILVTGPTGSGKTTTLFSMLRRINAMEKNILTIEDPVEYHMPLARQVGVNEKAGISFASAVRSFLRQDPDVILVGEIRDEEVAMHAMRASQTGHLVFSSLHTNDALGALMRLGDLKVDKYILSSSIIGVIAQRLVRKLCESCKRLMTGNIEEKWEGLSLASVYEHVGCDQCHGRGYIGRQAVAEVLVFDAQLKNLIETSAAPKEMEEYVRSQGYRTLNDSGVKLVQQGVTDIDEYMRVLA